MSADLSPELSAKLREQLDLPSDADDAAISAAIDNLVTTAAARDVDGAIAKGAIASAQRQFWLNSYKADVKAATSALASIVAQTAAARAVYAAPLAATISSPAADPSAISDQEANDALWHLGIRNGLRPPKGLTGYTLTNEDGTPYQSRTQL